MKRFLLFICCALVILFPVAGSAEDPLQKFTLLLQKDQGLSQAEKTLWSQAAGKEFQKGNFSFDYSCLLYSVLSRAKFDEVDLDRAVRVAFDCATAVQKGAPREEVEELAMFAFSTDLTQDEIAGYAATFRRCNEKNLPVHITQEMIRHAKERKWPLTTFQTIMGGLLTAAPYDIDLEKIALYMLISVDQQMGSSEAIVKDALEDSRKREPSRWKAPKRIADSASAMAEAAPPAVALDFEKFRGSVESFLGTPYLWGGTNRTGVDCSGFTKLVMKENGYALPRTSREQSKIGETVAKKNLRLGDLLFFDTKGAGGVTHVGFYLGGEIVVHASSSKGVTIVLSSDKYLSSRYLFARRVVRYR